MQPYNASLRVPHHLVADLTSTQHFGGLRPSEQPPSIVRHRTSRPMLSHHRSNPSSHHSQSSRTHHSQSLSRSNSTPHMRSPSSQRAAGSSTSRPLHPIERQLLQEGQKRFDSGIQKLEGFVESSHANEQHGISRLLKLRKKRDAEAEKAASQLKELNEQIKNTERNSARRRQLKKEKKDVKTELGMHQLRTMNRKLHRGTLVAEEKVLPNARETSKQMADLLNK